MEKRGVIEPGRTPPESVDSKTASQLEDHPTTRAADAAYEAAKEADAKAAKPNRAGDGFN